MRKRSVHFGDLLAALTSRSHKINDDFTELLQLDAGQNHGFESPSICRCNLQINADHR